MTSLKDMIFDIESCLKKLRRNSLDEWLSRDEGFSIHSTQEKPRVIEKKSPRIDLHILFLILFSNLGLR